MSRNKMQRMPSMAIPRPGLELEAPGKVDGPLESVVGLSLSDDMIEDMIKCFQDGQSLELTLGSTKTISYNSKSLEILPNSDPFTSDLYLTTNSSTSSIPARGPRAKQQVKMYGRLAGHHVRGFAPIIRGSKVGNGQRAASKNTSGKHKSPEDDALAQLKSAMATEDAKKSANTTRLIKADYLPPAIQRKGASQPLRSGKTNVFSDNRRGKASLPVSRSPAAGQATSPQPAAGASSASNDHLQRLKAVRTPIIHRLALGPATDDELLSLKPDGVEVGEFKTAIEKVASLRGDKLELERKFWRDLDPYNYDYSTEEDRQTAINNAISVFDRLRLNPTEPEWQKLLPYAERNRGKCLSKLQVQIAKNGNLAPKEKPRAPPTSTPSSENADEDLFGEDNTKADKMVTTRAKAKPKAAAKPKTAQKATARKAAQAKYAPSVKSSEYVHESDDSEEEPVATQPLNKAVPVTKQTVNTKDVKAPTNVVKKDVDTNGSRPTVAKTVSPVKKSPASNSGASKSSGAHRNSISSSSSVDLRSQRPRTDGNRVSKDRPTQKSSPLASSPPTNASDIDERAITPTSSTDGSVRSLKRKIIDNVESQQNKRLKPTVEVTHSLFNKDEFQGTPEPWVIAKAARWKEQHEEFVRLRAALEADPSLQDPERVNKVWRMHDELVLVKQELIDAARDPKN